MKNIFIALFKPNFMIRSSETQKKFHQKLHRLCFDHVYGYFNTDSVFETFLV